MVEHELPKLVAGVRFPSPAPAYKKGIEWSPLYATSRSIRLADGWPTPPNRRSADSPHPLHVNFLNLLYLSSISFFFNPENLFTLKSSTVNDAITEPYNKAF